MKENWIILTRQSSMTTNTCPSLNRHGECHPAHFLVVDNYLEESRSQKLDGTVLTVEFCENQRGIPA